MKLRSVLLLNRNADHLGVTKALKCYLTDHLAGAALAISILKALRACYGDTEVGLFARDLLRDVAADEAVLIELNRGIAGNTGGWKRGIARFFSRLGARKFVRQKPAPFGAFEAMETLVVGIRGKLALWTALRSLDEPRFAGTDFDELARRATAQHAAAESMRLVLAARAFTD